MSNFPLPEDLAVLVSGVTHTMCGTSFVSSDPTARGESLCGQMVLLSFGGDRPASVLLACDRSGGRALAASMFGVPPDNVTPELAADAIRELLSMVAGQVSRALGIDAPLGLARVTTLSEMVGLGGPGISEGVLLRSTGNIDLRLWVFEHAPVAGGTEAPKLGFFRSMLHKLTSPS